MPIMFLYEIILIITCHLKFCKKKIVKLFVYAALLEQLTCMTWKIILENQKIGNMYSLYLCIVCKMLPLVKNYSISNSSHVFSLFIKHNKTMILDILKTYRENNF